MLSFLSQAGSQLLKNILPAAINWGVNKLATTNFGKRVLAPHIMKNAAGLVNRIQSAV